MKKTQKILIMCLLFAVMLTGCKSSDYKKAQSLYQEGKLEEAVTMFQELGDYKDSASLVKDIQFQIACGLQNDGKYEEALAIYETLEGNPSVEENCTRCKLALAEALINDKKYEEAMEMLTDCQDNEIGKHFADICNVHMNGLEGIKTYLKENTEVNSNGSHTESVLTGKNNATQVFVYCDNTDTLKVQVEGAKRDSGDPILTITLTGDQAGNYSYTHSSLKNVNAFYAYSNDTLLINGKYYIGFSINASDKVDLEKYKKNKDVPMKTFTIVRASDGSLTEEQYKITTQTIIAADTCLVLEGLQQFLLDKDLRTSIADLGYKKYKTTFAGDPYDSANYPVNDYSAVAITEVETTGETE